MSSDNKLQINGIFTDFSKNLLSLATNKGFQIYSINSFFKISDSSSEKLGELNIAIPLYLSKVILIVGKNPDSPITNCQFILYDDKSKNQMCVVSFKEKIFSAKIIIEGIFISFLDKIKIFDLKKLDNIIDIDDIFESKINLSLEDSNLILSEISNSKRNILNIYNMKFSKENEELTIVDSYQIEIPCKTLYKISIDKKGKNVCIASKDNNCIFIYDIKEKTILHFNIEKSFLKIQTLEFYKDFICLFYTNNLLQIFNLKDNNKNSHIMNYFANYKFNYSYFDELIDENFGKNINKFIIYFTQKSEFSLIDSHGICQKIKFNTKEREKIWCVREIKFIK